MCWIEDEYHSPTQYPTFLAVAGTDITTELEHRGTIVFIQMNWCNSRYYVTSIILCIDSVTVFTDFFQHFRYKIMFLEMRKTWNRFWKVHNYYVTFKSYLSYDRGILFLNIFMPPPFKEWWRGIKCYPCPCVSPCVRASVRPSLIKIGCPLNNFWKTALIQFKFGMLIYNIKTQVEFDLGYNPFNFLTELWAKYWVFIAFVSKYD